MSSISIGGEIPLLPAQTLTGDNRIHVSDLFALCDSLPSGSVDMILADLPYGTTACKWDTIIPFEPLWARFKRIIKPRGAIVLTASQPFTSALVMSNPAWFRYEWVWDKKYHANPFLAKRQPLRITETVLVFSNGGEFYYPQMRKRPDKWMRENPSFEHKNGAIFGKQGKKHPNSSTREWMYPSNILDFPLEPPISRTTHHPTQKPVALFEYLIKTYTQAGELVFDPVVGSGTTAVACVNTGRRFICGDQSAEYVAIARERVRKAQTEARQMELIA